MIPDLIRPRATAIRRMGWLLPVVGSLVLAGCATGSETPQASVAQATLEALAAQTGVPEPNATPRASPAAVESPSPAPSPQILPVRSPNPGASPSPLAGVAASPEVRPCGIQALAQADALGPAVWEVAATGLPGGSVGRGTAFGVQQSGDRTILATSAHVVREADSIQVRNRPGDSWLDSEVTLDLLESTPGADVAFLAVTGRHPVLTLSRTGGPDSPIAVLGFGSGQARYATGEVQQISRDAAGRARLLVLSAGLEAGDSGSPVVDACGSVIGVATTVRVGGASDLTYAEAWEGLAPQVEATGRGPDLRLTGIAR